MSNPTDLTLGNAAAVRLIAGREISVRLHSKAFRVLTLILVIVVVGLCVALKLFGGSGPSGDTVGYLPADAAIARALPAVGDAVGQPITVVPVADQNTGQQRVTNGDLDALLVGDGSKINLMVKKDIDSGLHTALNILAGQVALDQQITALGGDPVKVHAATAGAKANVTPLQAPYPYQTQQLVLGIIAGILIYISLMLNGQTVAQGVVEEKSSRVVELLLATIRPWQLMAGKVAGIGLVGLLQVLIIAVAGIAAGLATNVLTISAAAAAGTVIWLVVWYLLGFFMYAVVFAGLGALVSRQEDIGGATAPALMFLIAGYVLGISILPSDPSSHLMEVLSVIPMFAPTVMPMRLAMGGVPAWEAVLSVLLVAALIPLLIWFAARIYRNAVLRTGARVKLSQALRAA
ncbi:MAG TPA: ABC transporter permease [Pseudonocardiaceae bacterium]|jgi:ABC-2 type transport system permease protein|nr:ABC transporter permease [Pseudonocardiaceae bacterium]